MSPVVNACSKVNDRSHYSCSCREQLEELGYPTISQLHISAEGLAELPEEERLQSLQQQLEQWSTENGIGDSALAVVVKPAVASSAAGLQLAEDLEGAVQAIAELLQEVNSSVLWALLKWLLSLQIFRFNLLTKMICRMESVCLLL